VSFLHRARAVLALAVNNWPAREYLAAVALTGGYALYEDVFVSPADASMSYVAPMLLTAPTNWLFTIALGRLPTDAPFYLGVAAGALVNAVAVGAVVRAVRRRRSSTARPAAPGV
jgi:hypothetical protein